MNRKQQEFFDSRAAEWEERCYPPATCRRVEELVFSLSFEVGSTVLDVGAGTGILHAPLSQALGREGQIIAFDLSFEMIKRAAGRERSASHCCFQGDVESIPLPSSYCDVVICFACFPHFDAPDRALLEMSRVLRRGGQFFIAHLLGSDELAEHHGSHPVVSKDLLPPADRMRGLCSEAGLEHVDITDTAGLYLLRSSRC